MEVQQSLPQPSKHIVPVVKMVLMGVVGLLQMSAEAVETSLDE
jgi:hypothetical protein